MLIFILIGLEAKRVVLVSLILGGDLRQQKWIARDLRVHVGLLARLSSVIVVIRILIIICTDLLTATELR